MLHLLLPVDLSKKQTHVLKCCAFVFLILGFDDGDPGVPYGRKVSDSKTSKYFIISTFMSDRLRGYQ